MLRGVGGTLRCKTVTSLRLFYDMIHQAKRRLASHIALDWRCATNPDPFAADAHSVRPNSRRAFFKRWGCLCRVNAGNYTLEECADPDR